MLKPYDMLEGVLVEIENRLRDNINTETLACQFSLSSTHLRRLFRFAFGQTIGTYIRSRKLAASIEDLLYTGLNILDIALEYGLEYEQSYIRAFKREFGLTPGDLRKTGQIVKIKPPLHLFDSHRRADGVFFGPEIVMIPQFHVIGKRHQVPFHDAWALPRYYKTRFINEERPLIPNKINPRVLIGINSEAGIDADYHLYMPSVQVKSLNTVPEGYDHCTFPSSLCARFHFIGLNEIDLNMAVADVMFQAIDEFMDDEKQKYFLERKRINIDRFDSSIYDGKYTLWEWFAPVKTKSANDKPRMLSGINAAYKQEAPALRFIGKKYIEPLAGFSRKKILDNLDNWCSNRLFDAIEQQSGMDLKTLYREGDSYICLMRYNDGLLEYWMGMFMPEGTKVPQGCEVIDFPPSAWGVCRVYGTRDAILNYDAECREKLAEEGMQAAGNSAQWFFLRFNWRWFFEEDTYGKRLLEYCYYL